MRTTFRVAVALALYLLVSCGGGTDGTGGTVIPPPPTAQSVVIGVMTKGSVIVNGVRFDDSAATIRIDDRSGTAAELQNGMFVKVLGRINSDTVSGAADRIQVETEVLGLVQSVNAAANPPSFTVAGLQIYVDGTTVFANASGVSALVAGTTRVEVYGLRDAAGNLRASRVEVTSAAIDELRGAVGNLSTTAQTFTLGTTEVSYAGATLSPAGASLANGIPVQVHGSFSATTGVFTATAVDREDLEDSAFQPSNGGTFEVEGFVSGFTAHPGTFQVSGRAVQTTTSTRFEGGTASDLGNGVKIQAEGTLDAGGTLAATKVEFKDGSGGSGGSIESGGIVELTGIATAVNISARTVTIFGKTVQTNDLTDPLTPLASIVAGVTRLEVSGSADASGNVIAQRLESTSDNNDTVQARVTAKNDTAFTLTLLDTINVALGGASVQFRDNDGTTITREQFFAAITARTATSAATLVKVRGTFGGSALTADQAELEN